MAPTLSRLLNFLTFFLTVLTCLQHASVNGVAEPASSSGSAWRTWVWALYVVSLITLLSWWPMKTNHVVLSSLSLSGLFVAFLAATSPLSIVVQLSYVARTCIFSVFGAMSRLSADTTTIEPRRVIDDVKIAVEVPFAAPAMERMPTRTVSFPTSTPAPPASPSTVASVSTRAPSSPHRPQATPAAPPSPRHLQLSTIFRAPSPPASTDSCARSCGSPTGGISPSSDSSRSRIITRCSCCRCICSSRRDSLSASGSMSKSL
ncbi:hypothetical protein BC938DRAFT_474745 [Jimgerdemannia flammicorona]|uniref:Uncharacterized protein n=1 Tax=Jimgerdemannia flammicorona TaxID=994334 RepID=A0A433Q1U3_9FUNG|nr:hypothetical protein BC938DRAFT_474745 [Jimgerdemannia flammicorona]